MMTKKIWIRFLSCLLGGALLASLASCSQKEPVATDSATRPEEQTTSPSKPDYEDQLLEAFDFDQVTFNVLTLEGEIFEQKYTGDLEKDAIHEKDVAIAEKFGVEVTYSSMPMSSIVSTIEKYFMSGGTGGDAVNCVVTSASALATCAQRGYLENLLDVQTVSFQSGYWVDEYTQNCSYRSGLYFAPTYASRLLYHAPHAVMFNSRIAQNYDAIGDLYQCVRDGNWTLETMKEYSELATELNDSTGEVSRYGICALSPAMYALYGGAGGTYSAVNESGAIQVTLGTENTVDILEKISKTFGTSNAQIVEYQEAISSFVEQKSLFWFSMAGYFFDASVRNASFEYGILPLPKYHTQQDEYISPVNPTSNYFVAMIDGQKANDVLFSGMMIEIFNYEGYEILRPVKYESIFQYQVAQNPDALEMLDLIFSNLYFDHNLMFNFGQSRTLLNSTVINATTGSYISSYKEILSEIEADIENYTYMVK